MAPKISGSNMQSVSSLEVLIWFTIQTGKFNVGFNSLVFIILFAVDAINFSTISAEILFNNNCNNRVASVNIDVYDYTSSNIENCLKLILIRSRVFFIWSHLPSQASRGQCSGRRLVDHTQAESFNRNNFTMMNQEAYETSHRMQPPSLSRARCQVQV
jgi:hypothetical protein